MSTIERNPTEVAKCGCPYDPEYDEGSLGWHLPENHVPLELSSLRRQLQEMVSRIDRLEETLREHTDFYERGR